MATPRGLVATECCIAAVAASLAAVMFGATALALALFAACALTMAPALAVATRLERRGRE